MAEWHARAPVRFCDLGGWTDTRIVPRGAVLNFAVRLYTHVTVAAASGTGITLESLDTGERCHLTDPGRVVFDGVLDLLKAAVARSGVGAEGGLTVRVRSDAPPGSGLGSSAALGVAAVAALAAYRGRPVSPDEAAREAQLLEVRGLGLECGVQDQFAAAHGGVNFLEVEYPDARVFPVQLSQPVRRELEDRLVLVYTGRSHFSSAVHRKVIAEADRHRGDFDRLAAAAVAGRDALLAGDLGAFAAAMNDNWSAQKALHPDITTPEIEALHRAVGKAVGFKANGAGGGGTVTILAGPGRGPDVRRAAEGLGMRVLPALIDDAGLQVREVG